MASTWTADRMPDCTGTTVLITGANSGLGFEATKALAANGATVIMACRSTDRGEQAAAEIQDATAVGEAALDVRQCDLASLASVEAVAEDIAENYDALDVLCNNAGVMALPRQETDDGFEKQLGVNHLGHFALTGRLLDLLVESDGESRVVTHSSGAHEFGELDFDDLQREQSYGRWDAYGQSKLANLLFAYELQRRLTAADITDTISVACHPGYAATNLQYRGPKEDGSTLRMAMMKVANAVVGQSAQRGALPLLYASVAAGVGGGEYYGPGGLLNMRGAPERQSSNEASYDKRDARRLWEESESLTGVTYSF
ncbi:probable oxidoreductase (short-chain dehydrogenase family) [Natronomonas pharaonis DSM 2160]|uniref:Probable oxidoreductase (Short-chain dehydrogenase family) n=1 Tax=Natronomonas pharaonis (strain ATCC 35678 / DSM 2160 / CIP 103997 / JCM 8858 / NBRC 14720 / NCIMB 2260 / Gabara) TaxID=348780 RepID=A0A1U7EXF7_NATPD|nr:oxidoreductase [Natronomonas pharaonis]CAI49874.1 probable oxidoreductase (short-chain dehydrogenase family) [Natronomonas pharaonis DSM 2160]